MEKPLSYQARREVLQQMALQYRRASPAQKRTLLDEFVTTTGYVRQYARWLLNHAEEVQQTHGHSHLRRYGPDVQHALFLVWHAANRICAKRLIPFLPTLIEALERHEHLHISEECRRQLLSMSAATADRLLSSQRKCGQRGLSTTRAGTLLSVWQARCIWQTTLPLMLKRYEREKISCAVSSRSKSLLAQLRHLLLHIDPHQPRQVATQNLLLGLGRQLRIAIACHQVFR